MSTPFQNRLVGTVIVAAAAVIFLPDFLDGEKQQYQADFEAIPSTPKIKITTENKIFPEQEIKQMTTKQNTDTAPLSDAEKTKLSIPVSENTAEKVIADGKLKLKTLHKEEDFKAPIQKPSVAVKPEPPKKEVPVKKAASVQQWVVQLGVFSQQKNVDDLVKKLNNAGFKSFTKPIKAKTGTFTKVFVGPELLKNTLEKSLDKLEKLTKVKGKVTAYTVTK